MAANSTSDWSNWREQEFPWDTLYANLSKEQTEEFRRFVKQNRLELELTESAIVADQARALHTLRQIKAMGVSIAIDDFGTGYSSLATLRAFPFDRIKLDQSLVSDIATSGRAKTFMRAILALGRSLDIAVLAEGVETAQQMAVLESEGYDEAQGFLLGRPGGLEGAMPGARGLRAVEGLESV